MSDFRSAFTAAATAALSSAPTAPAVAPATTTAPTETPVAAPAGDGKPAGTEAAPTTETPSAPTGDKPAEAAPAPADKPKQSATDYALEHARLQAKERALKTQQTTQTQSAQQQADAIELAKKFDAAKGDQIKLLQLIAGDGGDITATYKALTDAYVAHIEKSPEVVDDPIRKKLAELEAWKAQQEAATVAADRQRIVQGFRSDVRKAIEAQPSEFERVAAEGDDGIDFVQSIVVNHFNATKEDLSVLEALAAAEAAYDKVAQRQAQTKKSQALYQPKPAATPPPKTEAQTSISAQHSSRVTQVEKPKAKFKSAADAMRAVVNEHFG